MPAPAQHAQDLQRELGVVRSVSLGLPAGDDPSLERRAPLERLQVELAVLLTLGGEPLTLGRELLTLGAEAVDHRRELARASSWR